MLYIPLWNELYSTSDISTMSVVGALSSAVGTIGCVDLSRVVLSLERLLAAFVPRLFCDLGEEKVAWCTLHVHAQILCPLKT